MNEVGEKLKEARQAKGYTLDDLQQITKIQKRYLVAIEEGNLDVLPGNFYARAFIKQYADTVGLNGDQLLSEHTEFIPAPQDRTYAEKVAAKQTRSSQKKENIVGGLQNHLPTILVVVLVAAIGAAIYMAITRSNKNEGSLINQNTGSSQVEVTTNKPADSTTESSSEAESSSEKESESESQKVEFVSSSGAKTTFAVNGVVSEKQEIALIADGGDTWVSVTADGSMVEQGLVQDGSTLTAELPEGVKKVVLVIGNSSVTKIQLSGEEIPYAEEANNSVRQEITLEFDQDAE